MSVALQNKVAVENAFQLQHEKGALIDTVKKLNREIAKLESFKKSLIQHLQDEDDEVRTRALSLLAVASVLVCLRCSTV